MAIWVYIQPTESEWYTQSWNTKWMLQVYTRLPEDHTQDSKGFCSIRRSLYPAKRQNYHKTKLDSNCYKLMKKRGERSGSHTTAGIQPAWRHKKTNKTRICVLFVFTNKFLYKRAMLYLAIALSPGACKSKIDKHKRRVTQITTEYESILLSHYFAFSF